MNLARRSTITIWWRELQHRRHQVTAQYLNYPALTLGYRLEADGASLVYCCDHEPFSPAVADGHGEFSGLDQRHADFIEGADLLIHDAQYTAQEYPAKSDGAIARASTLSGWHSVPTSSTLPWPITIRSETTTRSRVSLRSSRPSDR